MVEASPHARPVVLHQGRGWRATAVVDQEKTSHTMTLASSHCHLEQLGRALHAGMVEASPHARPVVLHQGRGWRATAVVDREKTSHTMTLASSHCHLEQLGHALHAGMVEASPHARPVVLHQDRGWRATALVYQEKTSHTMGLALSHCHLEQLGRALHAGMVEASPHARPVVLHQDRGWRATAVVDREKTSHTMTLASSHCHLEQLGRVPHGDDCTTVQHQCCDHCASNRREQQAEDCAVAGAGERLPPWGHRGGEQRH